MNIQANKKPMALDSMVVTGICLAAFYWVVESFMYFFLEPEANFFHHLLGPDLFEVWTRLLVLCMFAIFGSHVQYNINKRRMADEKMRKQDEKYRTLIENIEEGFFEIDLKGNFTFFNRSVCHILGYSSEELMGMNNREYTSPENAQKLYRVMNHVYQTGKPSKIVDFEIIRKDGSKTIIELSAYLMTDESGNPTGFRGVARDVSDRIMVDREKQTLEQQLHQAQKMEAIGNLAGGIAHDFNNILMGMQGNVSLISLRMDRDDPFCEKVQNIQKYIESGATLTQQLLGFARGGKYEVKITRINDLIKKTANLFGRTKKEIRINLQGLGNVSNVEVDQTQIEQVLLNIFVNAWHAMPGGGDLTIRTEDVHVSETLDKPYRVERGPYVKISIVDTGMGMDQSTQDRIFEPFFTTKEMGRGTGLGLASAYGIVKNHGGFIEIFSRPGEGATFYIYLPASRKKAVHESQTVHEVVEGHETILLVDDEEMIIEVGTEMLEALGYHVIHAHSGIEAIETIQKNEDVVDLVILDMIMPGLGGDVTFDRIKQFNPEVKVLLSSGYSIRGQASEILRRGCDGFIQKPFKIEQLSVKIREILDN
jgi:PAS domain S-box-containing protein